MAVTAYWYGLGFTSLLNGIIDFDTDTVNISLHDSNYTPNQDTHDYWDDADNEFSGTGYTHEGATLASASITYTAGTNVCKLDATDVTWASSTITARYAVIYVRETNDNESPLLLYIDFGANVTSTNGDFKIAFNASGIATITPTAP